MIHNAVTRVIVRLQVIFDHRRTQYITIGKTNKKRITRYRRDPWLAGCDGKMSKFLRFIFLLTEATTTKGFSSYDTNNRRMRVTNI